MLPTAEPSALAMRYSTAEPERSPTPWAGNPRAANTAVGPAVAPAPTADREPPVEHELADPVVEELGPPALVAVG